MSLLLGPPEVVFQQFAHVGHGDIRAFAALHLDDDVGHCAFQLSDIRSRAFGDAYLDIFRHVDGPGLFHVLVFADEAFDDAQLGLDLGWLDVERAAGVEARLVAFVDVDVFRRAVG